MTTNTQRTTNSQRTRQLHRVSAITFTVSAVVTGVVLAVAAESAVWISYVPLIPLAFLLVTGLTIYARHWKSHRR